MTPTIREYRRLRALGWPGRMALDAARVNVRFEDEEDLGRVRFVRELDYGMTIEDLAGEGMTPRQMKEFAERVDRDGVWYVGTECRIGSTWVRVDSVSGFVGDDWKDSGYDVDMRRAAIELLDEATQGRCKGVPRALEACA